MRSRTLINLILAACFATAALSFKVTEVNGPAKSYSIDPKSLPAPFATEDVRRESRVIPMTPNSTLRVPRGFKVNIYAEAGNFRNPRMMTLAPNGDVFVSDSQANSIIVLRDTKKAGVADQRFVFTNKVSQPFGLSFNGKYLYVANTDSIVRFDYQPGQTAASGNPERLTQLTPGGYNQHWTRNLIFSPDASEMYVTIGSSSNVDPETDTRRAAVNVYDLEGKNHRLFATGLRNPVGLAFNPTSGDLWTAVNERDDLGNDLVPDYVTSVQEGGFYGWPYFYIGNHEEPRRKGEKPELGPKTLVPDVLLTSHSAALGLAFYTGDMFPKEYQGDAFVALHGSWNRQKLTGYKIIRIKFKNGKVVKNEYEDFVTGWLVNENGNEAFGRPVGLLVNADGSLLIADDSGKRIWRISH